MTDTFIPVITFVFLLANMMSTLGFLVLGLSVIPRSAALGRATRVAGSLFCVASALSHLTLVAIVLTEPGPTSENSAGRVVIMANHAILAGALWFFLGGIYLMSGQMRTTSGDPAPTSDPDT